MDCNKRDRSNVAIMKARVVARQRIIDPMTNEQCDDVKLSALGGIIYGPVHEIEGGEDYDELINEFEKLHPDFILADYMIEFIDN